MEPVWANLWRSQRIKLAWFETNDCLLGEVGPRQSACFATIWTNWMGPQQSAWTPRFREAALSLWWLQSSPTGGPMMACRGFTHCHVGRQESGYLGKPFSHWEEHPPTNGISGKPRVNILARADKTFVAHQGFIQPHMDHMQIIRYLWISVCFSRNHWKVVVVYRKHLWLHLSGSFFFFFSPDG